MSTSDQEFLIAKLVTESVKQVLLEERSILISTLISTVNSHISTAIRELKQELRQEQSQNQLTQQKQEFELELKTRIDELKSQHYQQLERLEQTVRKFVIFTDEVEEIDLSEQVDQLMIDDLVDNLDETFIEFNEFEELKLEVSSLIDGNLADINLDIAEVELRESEESGKFEGFLEAIAQMSSQESSQAPVEELIEASESPKLLEFESKLESEFNNEFKDAIAEPQLVNQDEEDSDLLKYFEPDSILVSSANIFLNDDQSSEALLESTEPEEFISLDSLDIDVDGLNEEFNLFSTADLGFEEDYTENFTRNSEENAISSDFDNSEFLDISFLESELLLSKLEVSETPEPSVDFDIENEVSAEQPDLNEFLSAEISTDDQDESPEIIYDGMDSEFIFEISQQAIETIDEPDLNGFDLDTELNNEFNNLKEGDRSEQTSELAIGTELESEFSLSLLPQNLLLEELEIDQQNLQHIEDQQLSEFADAEDDFWNGAIANSIETPRPKDIWHLGIDFGYSGIRACLFNQSTEINYPLLFNGSSEIFPDIKIGSSEKPVAIHGFKQFLRVGIPYQLQKYWQPLLQWTKDYSIGLKKLQLSTQELLSQIKLASHPQIEDLSEVMAKLETVIIGHPHGWSDAYIFNLRESVIGSGLISDINQILVVDEAIAILFPAMSIQTQQLIIDVGAFTTTLSFISGDSLPQCLSIEYAGVAINQDIVLQMLYPKTKDKFPTTQFITSGIENPEHRTNLQQFLIKSDIGLEALATAEQIKVFFCTHPEATIWQGNLGGKSLKINRADLEIKVIQPFIQSLNDAIAKFTNQLTKQFPKEITHISLAGGIMELSSIRQWLEAKFINSQITNLPSAYLACGLATAPKYPQYLDVNRHQYSDYFLLSEICALDLQEPLNLATLIKKLQNRGVNPKACGDRLSQILTGTFPQGILPWHEPEKSLILPDAYLDPQLLNDKLFTKIGDNDLYTLNIAYSKVLAAYLKMLESSQSSGQNFSEPLVFPVLSFPALR